MFRTADAAGVEKIILSGYTPTPLDRFGRKRPDFAKVSLGAEDSVPWVYVETPEATLTGLQKSGYCIAALEQAPNSIHLFDFQSAKHNPANKPVALIVGNEVDGVSPTLLAQADVILEIPMRGKKESLNVSVATGVALFVLANLRRVS
jgi:tRNA G18 (ribose-2'-O)-methylase SpoU